MRLGERLVIRVGTWRRTGDWERDLSEDLGGLEIKDRNLEGLGIRRGTRD